MPDELTIQGVRYLLSLVVPGAADTIREQLGIDADGPVGPTGLPHQGRTIRNLLRNEGSVWRWILDEGEPRAGTMLVMSNLLPSGLRADLEGTERSIWDLSARELVHRLHHVEGRGRLHKAREAAAQLRGSNWPVVALAHAADPLPGFARWALAERIDCPPQLRASFGDHPKFRHRLREAGLYDSPRAWVLASPYRACDVLPLYGLGTWAFPKHLAEAEHTLVPLLRTSVGTDVDAWADLARLLPTFNGTLPALLATLQHPRNTAALPGAGFEPA